MTEAPKTPPAPLSCADRSSSGGSTSLAGAGVDLSIRYIAACMEINMRIDQQQNTLVIFVTLIFGIGARERCGARLGLVNNHFGKEGHFA